MTFCHGWPNTDHNLVLHFPCESKIKKQNKLVVGCGGGGERLVAMVSNFSAFSVVAMVHVIIIQHEQQTVLTVLNGVKRGEFGSLSFS